MITLVSSPKQHLPKHMQHSVRQIHTSYLDLSYVFIRIVPLSSRSNTLCTLFDFKISGLSHLRSGKKANRKLMGRLMSVWRAYSLHVVQLNKYETAPNLIQLSQNLTSNCLLISVFLPVFAWCDHNIVLQIKTKQFYDHIMQKMIKTQKSANNSMSSFGLIE